MNNLIEIFTEIRTIPYQIINVPYSVKSSYDLINKNQASCTPKHIVLAHKYKNLGFQTRFCVHEFSWEDFQIDLNKNIKKLLKKCPIDFHTNLELKRENNWIRIDATWDDKLLEIGLPGTKFWNGKDNTVNCVNSLAEFKFDTIEEREEFIKIQRNKLNYNPQDELELINELNTFFNAKQNLCLTMD